MPPRRSASPVALAVLFGALLFGCAPHVPPATAAQRAQVRVVLYTTRWCPVCTHARSWLQMRGIPYQDRDVETDGAAAAVHRRLNPARTVPVIDVEGQILVGFVASELRVAVDRAAHLIPIAVEPAPRAEEVPPPEEPRDEAEVGDPPEPEAAPDGTAGGAAS